MQYILGLLFTILKYQEVILECFNRLKVAYIQRELESQKEIIKKYKQSMVIIININNLFKNLIYIYIVYYYIVNI